jgi:hypothetical protein
VNRASLKQIGKFKWWILAISPLAVIPFSEWVAITPIGTAQFLTWQLLYVLAAFVAVLMAPVFSVRLFFSHTRQKGFHYLLLASVFIISCMSGIYLGVRIRTAGMEAFVNRSHALVSAIHKYEQDHATPPASLEDLVPAYLLAYPSTGMMAYPNYHYFTGEHANMRRILTTIAGCYTFPRRVA